MFKCKKCGECCRSLKNSEIYKELHNGNGICRYLVGNICSIYDERPLICRVDDYYKYFLKNKLSLKEYYKMNHKICKKLQSKK